MVLQFVRDSASSWIIKIVLWGIVVTFVGTIFLVWGYGDESGRQPAATIGSSAITNAQLEKRYNLLIQNITRSGGSVPDDYLTRLQMRKSALNEMIIEQLQYMAAEESGFNVSDEELQENILSNPNFQVAGQFDKDLYFGIIRNNSLSPHEYESILRRDLMIQKVVRLITDSVQATEVDLKEEFNRINEKVSIKYMVIAPTLYEFNIKVTDEAVSKYFEDHADLFTIPETRKIEYVSIDPKDLADSVSFSDQEMKDYYDSHQGEFTTEEQVRARHILFEVKPDATVQKSEEKRYKAEDVLKELNEGADFAELAKKYSEGPTASTGGDLGFFGRGQMVQEFEREVFAMTQGQLSGPIRTRFGFHLIKLEEKRPAAPIDFENVKDLIKGLIITKKTVEMAKRKLVELVAGNQGKKGDWKEVGKAEKINYGTDSVQAGNEIPSIPGSLPISNRIFQLVKGDKAGPFELPNGVYFASLFEIVPPRKPELSVVRQEVEKIYKKEESRKTAEDAAEEFLKRLRGGAKLGDVAKETGLDIKESDWVTRAGSIEGESASVSIIRQAFQMNTGEYHLLNGRDRFYLMKLVDRRPPADDEFAEQRNDIRQKVTDRKRAHILQMWRDSLRKKASDKGILEVDLEYL